MTQPQRADESALPFFRAVGKNPARMFEDAQELVRRYRPNRRTSERARRRLALAIRCAAEGIEMVASECSEDPRWSTVLNSIQDAARDIQLDALRIEEDG